MSLTVQAAPDTKYDRFPEWERPLSQFEKRGAFLAHNDGAQAKLLMDTIKKRQFMDPSLASLIEIAKQKGDKAKLAGGLYLPYDFNRLRSEDASDLFLDASSVHTEEQDFVLTPIVINCIGGVGRTGMTTVGYWCHRKISTCPREQLSALTLNIPEMIYFLKKQRFNTAEKDVHLIALHSFFGKRHI